MKWGGLSSLCAKLESASYKNNKMQEIYLAKNLLPHVFTANS